RALLPLESGHPLIATRVSITDVGFCGATSSEGACVARDPAHEIKRTAAQAKSVRRSNEVSLHAIPDPRSGRSDTHSSRGRCQRVHPPEHGGRLPTAAPRAAPPPRDRGHAAL